MAEEVKGLKKKRGPVKVGGELIKLQELFPLKDTIVLDISGFNHFY